MYFVTFNHSMGNRQVKVHSDDRVKTLISTLYVLFEYYIMPFRLAIVPSIFMRLLTIVFCGMRYNSYFAYLNKIIIFERTFKENLERLDKVFGRFDFASLKTI